MKRALVFAVFCGATLAPAGAYAPAAKPESELADIERQLKERRDDEARLRDEAKEREKEVAALRRRMIETANALQDAERRVGEIRGETAKLEQEEASLQISLKSQQESLSEVLAALQSIERAKPPALLVSPGDAAHAARTAMLLADVTPQIEARAALLKTSLSDLASVRASLDAERAKLEKTNEEVSARRSMLAELLARKQGESRVAERLAAAAQSETAALAAREKVGRMTVVSVPYIYNTVPEVTRLRGHTRFGWPTFREERSRTLALARERGFATLDFTDITNAESAAAAD